MWEQDGLRWFYDLRPRPVRGCFTQDDRQRTARVRAMLAGWPRWMANVEAAVTA